MCESDLLAINGLAAEDMSWHWGSRYRISFPYRCNLDVVSGTGSTAGTKIRALLELSGHDHPTANGRVGGWQILQGIVLR